MELAREQIDHMHNAFDWDMGVGEIVDNILDRMDFDTLNENNIYERIGDALDCALIYDESQWALIKYYSEPSEPINICDASDDFIIDFSNALMYALGWLA